jgi:hypothetical protein
VNAESAVQTPENGAPDVPETAPQADAESIAGPQSGVTRAEAPVEGAPGIRRRDLR